MKCGKLFVMMFIMMDVWVAVSQPQVKDDKNSDSISFKTSNKEIFEKLEEVLLFMEDNRLLSWNREQSTINGLKEELVNKIDSSIQELKSDIVKVSEKLTNEFDKLNLEIAIKMDKSIKEMNIEIVKVSEKLTSEINKVHLKVNNVELKMDNITNEVNKVTNNVKSSIFDQNTIISDELKGVKFQSDEIVSELKVLKELNYNKTNLKCDNVNKLEEVRELLLGLNAREKNCAELLHHGDYISGIRLVAGISVVCDQDTDGGGWTVFQTRDYRMSPREDFYRNWANYSKGFGDLSGEFWLGLENINKMTKYTNMELRVDLEDDRGEKRFAVYKSFWIENAREKFRLNVGSYSGDAGDSLSPHNQMKFSTLDDQNDLNIHSNLQSCAKGMKGAWWYTNCATVNLNGFQLVGDYTNDLPFSFHGIWWKTFRGELNSMRKSKMMFRPERFMK